MKSAGGLWQLCWLLVNSVAKAARASAEKVTGNCSHSCCRANTGSSCFFLFLVPSHLLILALLVCAGVKLKRVLWEDPYHSHTLQAGEAGRSPTFIFLVRELLLGGEC